MAFKLSTKFVAFFVIGILLAFALQVYYFSPISPEILHLPDSSSIDALFPPNTYLQTVTKIGEGVLKDPEDVCVDKDGIVYTASRDGWIKRLHKDGTLEDWKWINSTTLLGMDCTADGGLAICDTEEGLLKVTKDGEVTNLVSHFNGSKMRLVDAVIEDKDGSLYFSDASKKFGLHEWYLDVLEAKPNGQLLKYNPKTKEVTLLLPDLYFANGVALSKDEDYLLICETWKFRCLKYWLEGELQGKTEIFIENLPGGPDNINLAPDGSFWIALVQLSRKGMKFVHSSKIAKHLLATYPSMIKHVLGNTRKATVIKVAPDGKVLRKLQDPNGKVLPFVTSALEYDGHLYLGSLNANFMGMLPLSS